MYKVCVCVVTTVICKKKKRTALGEGAFGVCVCGFVESRWGGVGSHGCCVGTLGCVGSHSCVGRHGCAALLEAGVAFVGFHGVLQQ